MSTSLQPDLEERRAFLQDLVDQAAHFHLYSRPEQGRESSGPHGGSGFSVAQRVHPFMIRQMMPDPSGFRAVNRIAAPCGSLEMRCVTVPWDERILPDREPRAESLDPQRSQRFAVRDARIRFAGAHGFRLFGTGRLFPVREGGRAKLLAGAVLDITGGEGCFHGLEGNLTFCGELSPAGFTGHMMVRVRDPQKRITVATPIAESPCAEDTDPDATFLTWIGQKSGEPEFTNSPSLDAAGNIRGLNIPVALKEVETSFVSDSAGVRVAPLRTGSVLGKEIGFGKESVPRTPARGTPVTPFQFEGVSEYRIFDRAGADAGSFVSNVVEGRSIQVRYDKAPAEPGLRFGFFGPGITGTGVFAGTQSMLYGASGSVFNPPPGIHVISNWYVLRVSDPEGRFRVPEARH